MIGRAALEKKLFALERERGHIPSSVLRRRFATLAQQAKIAAPDIREFCMTRIAEAFEQEGKWSEAVRSWERIYDGAKGSKVVLKRLDSARRQLGIGPAAPSERPSDAHFDAVARLRKGYRNARAERDWDRASRLLAMLMTAFQIVGNGRSELTTARMLVSDRKLPVAASVLFEIASIEAARGARKNALRILRRILRSAGAKERRRATNEIRQLRERE